MSGPGDTPSPGPESPATPPAESSEIDAGWRLLGALLALALAFAAVVMILNGIDTADAISCSDRAEVRKALETAAEIECYEHSDAAKSATVFLGFASAAFAAIAAFCALLMAVGGRLSRYLLPSTGIAIALGAATIVINNV